MNRREALKSVAALVGGTLSASTIAGVLGGCRAGTEKWLPKLVTPGQNDLISTLVEMIVPETDTPGARSAKVNEFIDLMLADWYTDAERQQFLSGLAELESRSQTRYGKKYIDCGPAQQVALLQEFEQEALTEVGDRITSLRRDELKPFFLQLKELTLIGYYTSEVGASQELLYNPVPGAYRGCVPFAEIGRAWS